MHWTRLTRLPEENDIGISFSRSGSAGSEENRSENPAETLEVGASSGSSAGIMGVRTSGSPSATFDVGISGTTGAGGAGREGGGAGRVGGGAGREGGGGAGRAGGGGLLGGSLGRPSNLI